MKNRVRLTHRQKVDIINRYRDNFTSMIQLAKEYAVTRQAIYKILKKAGIDTSKRKFPVSCTACGKELQRHRSYIRNRKHIFCDRHCYTLWLQAGNGFPLIENRQGQRVARSIVSQYFALQQGHVVHHEDRNDLNNQLSNLRVFANQGDHVRHHRDFDVEPLWDGRYP